MRQTRRFVRGFRFVVAALATCMAPPAAIAGTITVDPVRVDLTPDRKIAALRVTNNDVAPVLIQVSTSGWTQAGGVDVYADTQDVIASPPIATIPPGGTQLVRVGLKSGAPTAFTAYRLFVEEVPGANQREGQINVALRLNLPLYAFPAAPKPQPLTWSLARDERGKPVLVATNPGTAPVQVQRIELADGSQKDLPLSTSMGVVLPNSSRRWPLEHPITPTAQTPVKALARTDSGEQAFQINPALP